MAFDEHDFSTISKDLGVKTIKSIYHFNDLILVYKILDESIRSNAIFQLFELRENVHNLRNVRTLKRIYIKIQLRILQCYK